MLAGTLDDLNFLYDDFLAGKQLPISTFTHRTLIFVMDNIEYLFTVPADSVGRKRLYHEFSIRK